MTSLLRPLPERDRRPTRAVVRYEDGDRHLGVLFAVDVLTCGHKVHCTRLPGGKLRPHDEFCGECAEAKS